MKFTNRFSRKIVRLSLIVMLLGIVGIGLAACGGADATPTAPAAPQGTGSTGGSGSGSGSTTGSAPTAASQGSSGSGSGSAGGQEIKATLTEWSVSLNADQVNAGNVKFVISNEGQFGHDLVIQDSSGTSIGSTPVFKKADGPKELDVNLKPGTYTIICDVPGHADKGMKTTLTAK